MVWTDNEKKKLERIEGIQLLDDSDILIENFSAPYLEFHVFFQLIRLKDSYFLWVGDDKASFDDVSIAMRTIQNTGKSDIFSVSSLDNIHTDNDASRIALHFAKKTKKVWYISYNLPIFPNLPDFVEKCLLQRIQ